MLGEQLLIPDALIESQRQDFALLRVMLYKSSQVCAYNHSYISVSTSVFDFLLHRGPGTVTIMNQEKRKRPKCISALAVKTKMTGILVRLRLPLFHSMSLPFSYFFFVHPRCFVRLVFFSVLRCVALCCLLSRIVRRVGAAVGIFVPKFHQNVRLDWHPLPGEAPQAPPKLSRSSTVASRPAGECGRRSWFGFMIGYQS